MVFSIRLVPDDFTVPVEAVGNGFKLRPLTVADNDVDYENVVGNTAFLMAEKVFGPTPSWPSNVTWEKNIADVGWHEIEFVKRSSFAYVVEDMDGNYLGCVYIFASQKMDADAEVYYWVTEAAAGDGWLTRLGGFLAEWLAAEWPFTAPIFPGRAISWEAYQQMADGRLAESSALNVTE